MKILLEGTNICCQQVLEKEEGENQQQETFDLR